MAQIKKDMAAEYKAELQKMESMYEGMVAKERQSVSKTNVLNAKLEINL